MLAEVLTSETHTRTHTHTHTHTHTSAGHAGRSADLRQAHQFTTPSTNCSLWPALSLAVVLQCVAVCCSVLQCVTRCLSCSVLLCVAMYCSVLQCVAVCWSVWLTVQEVLTSDKHTDLLPLQPIALFDPHYRWHQCYSMLQSVAVCCSALQCVAVCCSVLQCVAVYCNVLQCSAWETTCCCVLQCVAVSYCVL